MNTKFLAGVVIALAIAAVVYFVFVPKSASSPNTTSNQIQDGRAI